MSRIQDKKDALFACGNLLFSGILLGGAAYLQNFGTNRIWIFLLIVMGIILALVFWAIIDYLKNEGQARGIRRLIISTGASESEEDPDLYGIGYKREPVKTSYLMIKPLLQEKGELTQKVFLYVETKLKGYFDKDIDEVALENVDNKVGLLANAKSKKALVRAHYRRRLRLEHISLNLYKIELFARKELASFFPDKAINVIKKFMDTEKIAIPPGKEKETNQKIEVEKFLTLKPDQLNALNAELLKEVKVPFPINDIQDYLKESFDTFYKTELDYLKGKGIKTFEQLINSNLDDLEREFNSKFLTNKREKWEKKKAEIKAANLKAKQAAAKKKAKTNGTATAVVLADPAASTAPVDPATTAAPVDPATSTGTEVPLPEEEIEQADSKYLENNKAQVSLKEIILYNQDEILDRETNFSVELEANPYQSLFKVRVSTLFQVFYRHYMSHFVFEKKFFFKVRRGQDPDNLGKMIMCQEAYFVHPAPWDETAVPSSMMINFGGWNFKHPHVAKIKIYYLKMIKPGCPLFYVGECSYTEDKFLDELTIDKDEIVTDVLKASMTVAIEAYREQEQLENIITSDKVSITDLRETIQYMKAQKFAYMDAKKVAEDARNKLLFPKEVGRWKWLLIMIFVMMLVMGLFSGMAIMYLQFLYNPAIFGM